MAIQAVERVDELPPDNASRLAIYDALSSDSDLQTSADELFDRVIGRLRVLVPRELHLAGERAYLDEKIQACIDADIVSEVPDDAGRGLALTGHAPYVRYPDGEIRPYTAGLEPARERLEHDNGRLRARAFDVRRYVASIADDPDGAPFQALLASMREHGFLKQFPIVSYQDDVVVDGLARLRAAAILGFDVEHLKYTSDKDRTAARRRDTPLNRILVCLHANAGRLASEAIDDVHAQVAKVTERDWLETAADLALTVEWRRATPGEYSPVFDVKRLVYREGDEPKVQVTPDDKVMLRSLIEAGGLSNYKIDQLRDYVPFERARSVHSAGRKAVFARAEDLISGITQMQAARQASKLKLDPEWEQIRLWLADRFGSISPQ